MSLCARKEARGGLRSARGRAELPWEGSHDPRFWWVNRGVKLQADQPGGFFTQVIFTLTAKNLFTPKKGNILIYSSFAC